MSQLRLQKRDDPLAISPPSETAKPQTAPAEALTESASTSASPSRTARQRATRRRPPARALAQPAPTPAPSAQPPATDRTYDDDRLEQTGWRMYEGLLAEVRTRAEQLTTAGIPTSAAALAGATLHSHLPRSVEEGAEIMRTFRQATAGRQRARRRS